MAEPEVGDSCQCYREQLKTWVDATILCIRDEGDGTYSYYVHYDEVNMRWDAWVPSSWIDPKSIRKKKAKTPEENVESMHAYFGKMRHIEYLRFGKFKIKAWYFSPVPDPFDKLRAVERGEVFDKEDRETLYCCEFCMHFFRTNREYEIHCRRCTVTHPPGDEIYRCGRVSAYEVDGAYAVQYCVNLCLVTKLFLYHKAAYYAPAEFYFYIVCFNDVRGAHPAGFFSKEKKRDCGNNLACILTFPCYQKMGIGTFLISLSYEFSKIEKLPGSPEKPLSDLGLLTYRTYWKDAIIQCLWEHRDEQLSLNSISNYTGMKIEDINTALKDGGFLKKVDGEVVLGLTNDQVKEWQHRSQKRFMKLDPKCIRWTPYPRPAKRD